MNKTMVFMLFSFIAILLFLLLFPSVRNIENLDVRTAAGGEGAFLRLNNGANLHYVEQGAGDENIILVHGFSSNIFTWHNVLPELSRHMHVFALDMIGFGFSDKPADFEYSYAGFANVLLEFMDKKGIGRATIVGNSMGGGIAAEFTALHPERVDNLILVDSAGYGMKKRQSLEFLGMPLLGKFLFSMNSPAGMSIILKRAAFYDNSRVTRERAMEYFSPFRTEGAASAAMKTIKAIRKNPVSDNILRIRRPTLIVWGENDSLIPSSYAHKFHRDIKDSKLVLIPKCGHLPEEEKPKEFSKVVLDFLSE